MIIEGWFVLFCSVIGPMLCVAAILICGLFRRKYVRSEWMEGLLYAEDVLNYYYDKKDHLFVEHTDGMTGYTVLGRSRVIDKPHVVRTEVSLEFGQGIIDYLSLN